MASSEREQPSSLPEGTEKGSGEENVQLLAIFSLFAEILSILALLMWFAIVIHDRRVDFLIYLGTH